MLHLLDMHALTLHESPPPDCCAGVAVTVDMLVTTCLVTLVMLLVWQTPKWLALPFFLVFGTIEGAYFSATLLKVPHGGW